MKLPRSYLYVPGNRPERFDKALSSGADAVIIDFEDAVAPADKPAAREAFAAWAASAKPVYVRVNAENSEWFNDDLATCKAPGVRGIILPKAETIGNRVVEFCGDHRLELLPLIETALGMANVASIATTPGVQRLLFGTIDFQFELGIHGDGDELLAFLSQLCLRPSLRASRRLSMVRVFPGIIRNKSSTNPRVRVSWVLAESCVSTPSKSPA